MRPLPRLIICILLAGIAWLADSLLLSYTGGIGFAAALWAGAEPVRLLIRLAPVLLLLLFGFASYILYELRSQEVRRMNFSRRGQLFGDARSDNRSSRMLYHSMRLAVLMRMRPREKDNLRILCYCHDLGLVGLPTELAVEYGSQGMSREALKQHDEHVDLGAAIAAKIPQLQRAASVIACHEEHYDGSGPKGMFGRSIPLACRIFALVRIYDYCLYPEPGRQALSGREALSELDLYKGSALDPDVLAAFHRLMDDERLSSKVSDYVYASR